MKLPQPTIGRVAIFEAICLKPKPFIVPHKVRTEVLVNTA